MCGHVGVAGDLFHKDKEAFTDLLIIDSLRGTHGTGVASFGWDNQLDWCKVPSHAYDLVNYKQFDRVVGTNKKVIIGHNRLATRGAHTIQNTHPFAFKHVVGCHNGTLPNRAHYKLDNWSDYDTDSEAILSHINGLVALGADPSEAVKSTLEQVGEGAWALVMYFPKHKELIFVRNKERPFSYCFNKDHSVLYWASEPWMLHGILSRHNIEMSDEKVRLLAEDTITSYSIPTQSKKAFDKPRRLKVEIKPKSFIQTTGYTPTTASSCAVPPTSRGDEQTGGPTFPNQHKKGHFKPPYKSPYGDTINRVQFDKLLKQGGPCCYCNEHTPKWGEEVLFLPVSPIGTPQYLCKQCCHDPEIINIAKAMR